VRESFPPIWLITCAPARRDAIVWRGQQQTIANVEATKRAWEFASGAIASGLYKTVILDELNPTVESRAILPGWSRIVQNNCWRKQQKRGDPSTGRCKNAPTTLIWPAIHFEIGSATTLRPRGEWNSNGSRLTEVTPR